VTIGVGGTVTFRNQDSVAHQIASNPHPTHTDCPPINNVGALSPGQSRPTGALTVARTCGYHDHDQPGNAGMQGSIVIQ
jgi:plastocyanin